VYIWDVDLDKSGNVYILLEKKLADIWIITYSPGTDSWSNPLLIEDRSATGGRAYVGNLAVESEGIVHEAHWSQKAKGIQGTQYNKITNALTDSPAKNTIWLISEGSRGAGERLRTLPTPPRGSFSPVIKEMEAHGNLQPGNGPVLPLPQPYQPDIPAVTVPRL